MISLIFFTISFSSTYPLSRICLKATASGIYNSTFLADLVVFTYNLQIKTIRI